MTQTLEPPAAPAADDRAARRSRRFPSLPLLVAGCFALAALSLLLPSVPTQDSWSWIVWGREVAHLDLDTTAGSSWKPLPVLFTTVYSLFGDAAPQLWIMTARAGGLLAILFAFRIAKRLAGWPAGVAAAAFMVGADWLRFLGHGNVEPLSAGLVLGAVDRHIEGHRHQAMALGALAALGRPELWPFLALYAGLAIWRKEARRVVAIALVIVVPVMWLGGDWWGSGDPFHGSTLAKGFRQRQTQHRQAALKRDIRTKHVVVDRSTGISVEHTYRGAIVLLIPPAFIAALVALAFAVYRRERTALALGAAALVLFTVIATMGLLGYGGSPRFLFPAAGMVAVLAGVGVAELMRAAGGRWRAIAVAAAVIAVTVPFALDRAREFRARASEVGLRADLQDQLDRAVELAGGPSRVLALGTPRVNTTFAHQLAWDLGVHQSQIGAVGPRNVVFDGKQTTVSPSRGPRVPSHGVRVTQVAAVGAWRVLSVEPAR